MRRAGMRVEVLAGLPALDNHVEIGIVDAHVALIGNTALLLPRLGNAFLVALDECIPAFRLHLRGSDDINHDKLLLLRQCGGFDIRFSMAASFSKRMSNPK